MLLAGSLIVLVLTHPLLTVLQAPPSAAQPSAAPPSAAPPSAAQQPAKPPANAAKVTADDLPVSLDRIQRALARTPKLQFDEQKKPVFRVQVFGDKPTIEDILGPDWAGGPVPYGTLTHQEFLKMVTPADAQGYAAFSSGEGATVATTSLLLQWTLQKAIAKYRETKDERAREAARQEVMQALEALERARAKK